MPYDPTTAILRPSQNPLRSGVTRLSKLAFALVLLLASITLVSASCGGDGEGSSDSDPEPTFTTAGVSPEPTGEPELTGFAFPIDDACLPGGDNLMPGAPRTYRMGTHEGIDFYDSDNCTPIGEDTEVFAAKAGTIVRADWDYEPLTYAELAEIDARIAGQNACDEESLDRFRGRQVWVDHGNGVITRYAHLGRIADDIEVGLSVRQGELIAYVGNSGTPESLDDPNAEMHLHMELRVGDGYLGKGLSASEVRALYEKAFARH